MRRQLRRSGGIMDVTPRENFGLGSKLKKRFRKIIPNEIADIAVKAAPFVAPFNPAAAAAMAGIGGFDQTGSIGDSLKGAALTYGLGQGARFIGGAGFQGNPFTEGGAFRGGLEGFKSGFSSPLGTETGLGKMLSDNAAAKGKALKAEGVKPVKESTFFEDATQELLPGDTASAITKDTIIQNDPSIFELVKQGDYGDALMTGAKKFGKAMFTNEDGSLDKNALLAAGAFGLTYLDALRIANEAGEELPREEYDEAAKEEFKEKYDGYLQNFFGGKADGGRIGYADGGRIKFGGGTPISFSRQEKSYLFRRLGGSGGSDRSFTMPNLYKILNNPGDYPDDAAVLKEIAIMGLNKKDGGRIGFESGANKQMAIENAMSELRKKYPELSEENLFNLVMSGFGGKIDEKELPAPSIKIDNNIEDLPRGLQIDTTTSNPIPENVPNMAMGGEVPVRKNEGGVMELDYRDTGGFVPIGIKERADDVPAMLSKNEFVLTADAVRGIGNGDVEKGAETLYGIMKQAEKVGQA